jgi:hypothetical protein
VFFLKNLSSRLAAARPPGKNYWVSFSSTPSNQQQFQYPKKAEKDTPINYLRGGGGKGAPARGALGRRQDPE